MNAASRHSTALRPPLLALALVAAGGAASWSCAPDPGVPQVTPPGRVLAECPMDFHEPDSLADTLALPGRLTRVPEFHDCQRFIVAKKSGLASWKQYGPLQAIWVRDSLAAITFPLPSGGVVPASADSIGTVNPLGGTPYVVAGTTHVAAGPETTEIAVAVALVYSTGPYEPLGLEKGFNCLYLFNPADWQAKMVPVAEQQHCSKKNIDPSSVGGTALEVRAVTMPGATNQDYPPVARWDADSAGQYFVGIKCIAAWCEIGSGTFETSPSYAGSTPTAGRERIIKGWYDEQYLAVHTTTQPVWPTSILGTAFPDPALDSLLQAGYTTGVWYHVASTVLRDGPSGGAPMSGQYNSYHAKFTFEQGVVGKQENEIFFCQGSREACEVPTALSCEGNGQGEYWARIVSAQSGDAVYKCVTFTNHDITMPGVVRWRWVKNDEKNWVSCPNGCCQVNQ